MNAAAAAPIAVVGMHGGQVFGREAGAAIGAAAVVVASGRQFAAASSLVTPGARHLALAGPLEEVLDLVDAEAAAGRTVCVLASGDPGFFGIVRVLAARFGSARLAVHPAPSSLSLAFARVGRPWDDAAVVSAHGRPLDAAVAAVRAAPQRSVAVLTAPDHPPQMLAAELRAAGEPGSTTTVVATRLGEEGEQVAVTDLDNVAAGAFDPMSVVLLLDRRRGPDGPTLSWGLPESAFDHRDGMITKAEVRAVALGKLALPPAGVLWDVGAGSGSVGIECARIAPGLAVYAVERDGAQVARIRSNAERHLVSVTAVEGSAPEALAALPDPDRVFVGGGGPEVLDAALTRLRPGGVVVATFALVDRAVAVASRLGNMVQLSTARAVATGDLGWRLRAENPVFVCWGPSESAGSAGSAGTAGSAGSAGSLGAAR